MISHEHILLCSQPPWSSDMDTFYPTAREHVSGTHPTLHNESECGLQFSWEQRIVHIPQHATKGVECTLWFASWELMSTEFLMQLFSSRCWWQPFCKWLYPAFSFPSWPQQSLSSWRGWVVADSLQTLSLMVTTPWQGRLSSATQCSDKKENMLLGSSPSSAKRKSLD